jgi:hypothetical protein
VAISHADVCFGQMTAKNGLNRSDDGRFERESAELT